MHRVRRGRGHDPGGRHVPAHGRGQKRVFPEIPGFTAVFVQNAAVVRQGGHKAALGVGIVLPVVEIQILDSGFIGRAGGGGGRFAACFRGSVPHGGRICRVYSQAADNAAGQARRAEKEMTEHPHNSSWSISRELLVCSGQSPPTRSWGKDLSANPCREVYA